MRVRRGDTVLVHSAAGGVGLLLCQWAKHLGATVIGTVSTDEKARIARANGCDYPIVYTADDFVARVKEITGGRGARVVYDAVGKDTFARSIEALAPCGHLASYGQASGGIDPIDPEVLAAKSTTLSRPVLFHYTADPRGPALDRGQRIRHARTWRAQGRDQPALCARRRRAGAP